MIQYATKETALSKRSILHIFLVLVILTMSIAFFSRLPSLKESYEFDFEPEINESLSLSNNTEKQFTEVYRSKLIEQISLINKEEKIKNEEIFGNFTNYSVVIAVQVNTRIHYLQHLIKSLRQAKDINKTLLVFSHDFFDDNINHLVNSIKFCKFMQVFYPHSFQVYPDVFPGYDRKDCPAYTTKNKAIEMDCINYRNAQLNQAKHHWWWKANRIFDMASLKSYNGLVLFLEEDNYVLEDFIHVLKLMEDITKYSCRHCKLIALASDINYEDLYLITVKTSKVAITDRFSNIGMAFNRSVWREIVKCKHTFCTFHDYNWDYSLRNVFRDCIKETNFLVLFASRVFHIGVCGLHFTARNCDPAEKLEKLKILFYKGSSYLFPTQLHLVYHRQHPGYGILGGWTDPRDHALCLGMIMK